jgi:predicted lipoprotein with Yx(FWY)xxD motif
MAVGLVLGACSSSSKSTTASVAPPTTAGAASPSTGAPTTAPAASGAVLTVANDAKYGAYLVGPNGHTLYMLETEVGTTSMCTGGCAAVWPGLTATGTPTVGTGVDQAKTATANGQVPNQIAYNGHLLYYFMPDTAPGDFKGTSIPHWYPVSPAGAKIDKS